MISRARAASNDVLCGHEKRVDILEAVELGLVDLVDDGPVVDGGQKGVFHKLKLRLC